MLLLVGLAFAVLPVGPALAATTIGATVGNATCSGWGGFEFADSGYVVPAGGGTINSFSFADSTFTDAGDQLDFNVVRPTGPPATQFAPGSYVVVGHTGLESIGISNGIDTFPAHIPVQAGDLLGYYIPSGERFNCGNFPGSSQLGGFPGSDPGPGTPITMFVSNIPGSLNESANLVTDSDLALAQPSDVTVNATSPGGALASYTIPTASDESLTTASVGCSPTSGSSFAIGDTTVTCTATDTDGDTNSPVQKSFNVHVKGATEQLNDLANAVNGVGQGSSLADKVASVQSYLTANDTSDACVTLNAFINEIKAQTGKKIPATTAASLIAAARQIEAVIPCAS